MQRNEKSLKNIKAYRWELKELAQIKQPLFIATLFVEAHSLADSYRILQLYLPDCQPFFNPNKQEIELDQADLAFIQNKPELLYV